MHSTLISTECVADLPNELREKNDIHIIYYDVKTEEGVFRDTDEIDARNLIEYISGGERKAVSIVPSEEDFEKFFRVGLKKYNEILHINISSGISESHKNAAKAIERMGEEGRRVTLVDSRQLSSGQGLLTLEAAKLRDQGLGAAKIAESLESIIPNIETSFIAYNADHLYYNGKVNYAIKIICNLLMLHPVLYMKDGRLSVKTVYMGSFEKASMKYVRKILKNPANIDHSIGFVTHAGCSHRNVEKIKKKAYEVATFEKIYDVQASATVSCNCGPNTFGVLFERRGD